jgi:hypothetical protein
MDSLDLHQEIENLNRQLMTANQGIEFRNKNIEGLNRMVDRIRLENDELRHNLEANENALSQLKDDYEHTYRIIEQLKEENLHMQKQPLERVPDRDNKEIELLKSERNDLLKKLQQLESNPLNSKESNGGPDRDTAIKELRAENEGLIHQLYDIDQERARLQEQLQSEELKLKALELQLQNQPTSASTSSNKELEKLKSENLELKKQLINRSTTSNAESRGTGGSTKLLEEQVGILTAENGRLKEDRMKAMIDLERFKKMDENLKLLKEENHVLKEKNHGLETDISKLWKEEESIKEHSNNLIDILREENRQLKESTFKRGNNHEDADRHNLERLLAEKSELEQKLAHAEKERDGLKRLVEEQKRQLAGLSKERQQVQNVQVTEDYQKILKENYLLQQKVALLEEREKDLLENETNKERMIGTLKQEIARLENEENAGGNK